MGSHGLAIRKAHHTEDKKVLSLRFRAALKMLDHQEEMREIC
jgi:hypothetical protein